jgi:thiamine-monophosphate kinase
MGFTEARVIELLAEVFGRHDPRVYIGIGDDAALVQGSSQQILTTDIAVEGTHFRPEWSSGYEIGARVAAANIADVMSMNGETQYLLVAATLTGQEDLDWIRSLAQGIADEAAKVGAVVVGGDLARSTTLSIAITAVGRTEKPIRRGGASIGESIYLSSLTGWSAAGLEILTSGRSYENPLAELAVKEFRTPTLDIDTDFADASSMSDVSDSILIQGVQMADASGLRFQFDLELLSQSDEFKELRDLAELVGGNLLNWIFQGGEDHALLATGSNLPGICIGKVVEGSGVAIKDKDGEIKMAPVSWSHFG